MCLKQYLEIQNVTMPMLEVRKAFKNHDLSFYHKTLRKEEELKLKVSKRKEIISERKPIKGKTEKQTGNWRKLMKSNTGSWES